MEISSFLVLKDVEISYFNTFSVLWKRSHIFFGETAMEKGVEVYIEHGKRIWIFMCFCKYVGFCFDWSFIAGSSTDCVLVLM